MKDKLYHTGIRGNISRSTIADANEKRSWRIYRDFAHTCQARQLYAGEDFGVQLDQTVYALDATIIYTILQILSLTLFEKMPLYQAFTPSNYINEISSAHIQLNLFES